MKIHYFGHSAFALEGSENILIDPFISGNPHMQGRSLPQGMKFSHIFLTHGHSDHTGDVETLAKFHQATVVANFELASLMAGRGLKVESCSLGGLLHFPWGWVRQVPATHSSSFEGQYAGAPVGLIINIGGVTVYHAGDTGLYVDVRDKSTTQSAWYIAQGEVLWYYEVYYEWYEDGELSWTLWKSGQGGWTEVPPDQIVSIGPEEWDNEDLGWGEILGVHYVYDENYGSGEGYFLESFNRIHGSGFDVKLGTIFRPIEASPLRIGLSVHTPIFYRLTYATGAYIQSDVYVDDDQSTTGLYVDTYEQLGNRDMEFDFRLQTPWVVNASVGYTVGNNLALGAEYEFENFSNMKFKDVNNYDMDPETDEVKYTLKGVHTFRLGAEYKPISAFAFRVGYNYSSTAYKADAYKNIFSNSVSTDTEYSNDKSRNTFTVGIGYRGSLFYADLAYKYDMYKSDFYPFYNNLEGVKMAATKVSNTRSQVLLTLGCRF